MQEWRSARSPTCVTARVELDERVSSARLNTGVEADHRSGTFSFGVMLHEMLSGQRAFQRERPAQTMTAILVQGRA